MNFCGQFFFLEYNFFILGVLVVIDSRKKMTVHTRNYFSKIRVRLSLDSLLVITDKIATKHLTSKHFSLNTESLHWINDTDIWTRVWWNNAAYTWWISQRGTGCNNYCRWIRMHNRQKTKVCIPLGKFYLTGLNFCCFLDMFGVICLI